MGHISRRHLFIASGLGLSVWLPVPGFYRASGNSTGRKRRHFINIQGFGGWDSTWHHSPMLERDTAGLSADSIKANFLGVYDQPRFPDDKALLFNGKSDQKVGVGMSAFTSLDHSAMLIWRGIDSQASHDIGNRYNQCGSLSGYAASYSVLVARALALSPEYLRPLHYVQTTGSPGAFRSQVGFVNGAGVPINVPSYGDWVKLSAVDPNDPLKGDVLRTEFATVMNKFMEPTGLKPAAAKKYQEEFRPSYEAGAATRDKNFATDPAFGFAQIMESYRTAIAQDVAYNLFSAPGSVFVKEGLGNFGASLPTSSSGVASFLSTYFGAQYENMIYNFAVAEFLVIRDLSAVVDCTVNFGDFHNGNHQDFLQVMVGLAALRKLMGTLRKTEVPDGKGENFLDITTIALTTEFDRTVNRYPQDPASTPGTNHGGTVSVIMAGYGVAGGKIIGGRGTGPQGPYGGIGNFNGPLPIDLKTGLPSASGTMVDNGAIQPTILKIFGLTQPSQQFVGASIVDAVIKPGHVG